MILYNVTIKILPAKAQAWLEWMQNTHIPQVMATGCFTQYRIAKMLFLEDEAEGLTFNIQYTCPDLQTYQTYQEQHAPKLQADHNQYYTPGQDFVAFRSLMQTI